MHALHPERGNGPVRPRPGWSGRHVYGSAMRTAHLPERMLLEQHLHERDHGGGMRPGRGRLSGVRLGRVLLRYVPSGDAVHASELQRLLRNRPRWWGLPPWHERQYVRWRRRLLPGLPERQGGLRERRLRGPVLAEHVSRMLRREHLRRGRPELPLRRERCHLPELRASRADLHGGRLPIVDGPLPSATRRHDDVDGAEAN
jgi:hypothetical protein